MNNEDRIKEVDKLLNIIGTAIKEGLNEGHSSTESTYYLIATCLEAMITHEYITGENLLREKTKVLQFTKPKLVPDDNKPIA